MLLDVVTVAVLGLVGLRLATLATRAARSRPLRDRTLDILRGLRVRHFALGLPTLVAVATTAFVLIELPVLDWGWWSALGGTGNVVTGSTERGDDSAVLRLLPFAFLALLLPLLPLLAEREEQMFRLGAERWSAAKRVRRAVEFGLIHLVMGVPIGVALALSIGGGYFTWAYLRGYRAGGGDRQAALLESTRAHAAYNAIAVVLALVGLALAESTR